MKMDYIPPYFPFDRYRRPRRDPMLTIQLRRRHSSLGLLQIANDLLFVESTPARTTPPPGPGRAILNGKSHISTRLISGVRSLVLSQEAVRHIPAETEATVVRIHMLPASQVKADTILLE